MLLRKIENEINGKIQDDFSNFFNGTSPGCGSGGDGNLGCLIKGIQSSAVLEDWKTVRKFSSENLIKYKDRENFIPFLFAMVFRGFRMKSLSFVPLFISSDGGSKDNRYFICNDKKKDIAEETKRIERLLCKNVISELKFTDSDFDKLEEEYKKYTVCHLYEETKDEINSMRKVPKKRTKEKNDVFFRN